MTMSRSNSLMHLGKISASRVVKDGNIVVPTAFHIILVSKGLTNLYSEGLKLSGSWKYVFIGM